MLYHMTVTNLCGLEVYVRLARWFCAMETENRAVPVTNLKDGSSFYRLPVL